jgi:predicted nuclease of predicted toxin-antitoxin system
MRLKLDENLSRHLKPALAELGHDVLTAADEGLLSRPDTEVAATSLKEGRMLLTLDIEFADLRSTRPGRIPASFCSVRRHSALFL